MNENAIMDISLYQNPVPLVLGWMDRHDKGPHFQVLTILVQEKLG